MSTQSKKSIVFTDSGLGGLSIMALFFNNIKKRTDYVDADELELIFYNALPESGQGYNRMDTMQKKIHVFNQALETMKKNYDPTVIAIACNTLSAVYPMTPFARENKDTFEIISSGRYLINQQRRHFPDYPVFVLATPTTIWSGAYEMNDSKVYQVSGVNLASQIEMDHTGPDVKETLKTIFSKIKTLSDDPEIVLFLGCTHYGYIEKIIEQEAQKSNLNLKRIINPNVEFTEELLESVIPSDSKKHARKAKITLRIESQAVIDPQEIKTISFLIQHMSPEIVEVLENYRQIPKSF